MEWNQIESQWDKLKGQVKQKWGMFTDDDILQIKGRKDDLIGRIKHVYGVAKEDAEIQIDEFRRSLKKSDEAPEKKTEPVERM